MIYFEDQVQSIAAMNQENKISQTEGISNF